MTTFFTSSRRTTELLLLVLAGLPVMLLYALFMLNQNIALSFASLAVPFALLVAFVIAHIAVRLFAPEADPALLPIVFLLSGIGISFVTRLAPQLATNQLLWLFISVLAMIATLIAVPSLERLKKYTFTIGVAGIALLLLPMIIGVERGGSKLWLSLGPFSFQPGELAKILIVVFLASYFAENREALSASTRKIGPLAIPRLRMLTPVFVMWALSLLVVVFERDLGSALLFFTIFVVMLYVATGRLSYVIVSVLLLSIGAVVCYRLFGHVRVRVDIWLDPWKDPSGRGMQIVQSLYSLADGGMLGAGIGRGLPRLIPVVESDFIFSALGEELGLLGASAVLILYILLAVRAFATAARAKTDTAAFTTVGLTTSLSFQAFIIVAGVTRLMPLTGVTLPFISQGGSSLLSSFIIVALILRAGDEGTGTTQELEGSGIRAKTPGAAGGAAVGVGALGVGALGAMGSKLAAKTTGAKAQIKGTTGSHFRARFSLQTPESGVLGRIALGHRLTSLIGFFTLMFAVLIANLTNVQVIQAQNYQNKPGNNHTIIKSAYVQRGSILTSDGKTLAESVKDEKGKYVRNYPSGAMAAHSVGYISTRYGASGVEASFNDTLTGKADYSTWPSALNALAGAKTPGNSVVLTINSKLQQIAEEALRGRVGSIVLLNPKTGAVLACASSPSFSHEKIGDLIAHDDGSGTLLNRATQALYAPGSTFKVVSLAAALDSGAAQLNTQIKAPASVTVGNAEITNNRNADYGEISLQKALAVSANTAFAQLGEQVGAERLVSYANNFGYGTTLGQDFPSKTSLMPKPDEMTLWETAWAACGQPVGEHKSPAGPQSTIMQNAVIAAAIANNGVVQNPYLVEQILSPEGTVISATSPKTLGQAIAPKTAGLLKQAMLSVITEGTGQAAKIPGVTIAGKTGTAQMGNNKINSLFIGFAPYDTPTLAISLCIEGKAGEDIQGDATRMAKKVLSRALEAHIQGS